MSDVSDLLGDEKIRFHVVDDENRQRSTDWIIWESNESVYLSTVCLSGQLKLSMHPRGLSDDGKDTQFSITASFWKRLLSRGHTSSVPFHRWKRPDPDPNQVCLVASVTFPTEYLGIEFQARKLGGRKLAFPLPAVGHGFELSIFNHSRKSPSLESSFLAKGLTPFISIGLASGEIFSIAGRNVEFPFTREQLFPQSQGSISWFGQPIPIGDQVSRASAIMVHDFPKDGEPILLAEINGFSIKRER